MRGILKRYDGEGGGIKKRWRDGEEIPSHCWRRYKLANSCCMGSHNTYYRLKRATLWILQNLNVHQDRLLYSGSIEESKGTKESKFATNIVGKTSYASSTAQYSIVY